MKRTHGEVMEDFLTLVYNLSPENLSCDGELSPQEVEMRARQINVSWKKLEKEINSSMTQDSVYDWDRERGKKMKLK